MVKNITLLSTSTAAAIVYHCRNFLCMMWLQEVFASAVLTTEVQISHQLFIVQQLNLKQMGKTWPKENWPFIHYIIMFLEKCSEWLVLEKRFNHSAMTKIQGMSLEECKKTKQNAHSSKLYIDTQLDKMLCQSFIIH